jgi:hypothetical protein
VKYLKGSGHGIIEALAWRNSGKPRKISVRIVGVRAKIQTELLPNTKPERYL